MDYEALTKKVVFYLERGTLGDSQGKLGTWQLKNCIVYLRKSRSNAFATMVFENNYDDAAVRIFQYPSGGFYCMVGEEINSANIKSISGTLEDMDLGRFQHDDEPEDR